jgi:hypothetical protein
VKTHKKLFTVGAYAFLLFVLVAYVAGPLLLCQMWHLRYGSTQRYGALKVFVPSGWFVASIHGKPMILNVQPSFSKGAFYFSSVRLDPLKTRDGLNATVLYERWIQNGSKELATGADGIMSVRSLQVGGHPTSCLERPFSEPDVEMSIMCMIQGQTMVFFNGRKTKVGEFYRILENSDSDDRSK